MHTRSFPLLAPLLFAALLVLACDLGASMGGTSAKPTILIQSPVNGSQFQEGAEITIQSVATDASGIATVDLIVDGAVVRTDKPSAGQSGPLFAFAQKWQATAGAHTIGVRAYNAAGTPSDPVTIAIIVSSSVAQAPSPFPGLATTVLSPAAVLSPPTPTSTVTAMATVSPTATVTSTLTATATVSPLATVTSTSSATATVSPTETVTSTLSATATVSPTATVTPTATILPGVYVTSLRTDPPAVNPSTDVGFYVTFLNTTNSEEQYRWNVYAFRADNPKNSFGEASAQLTTIPVGTVEQKALGSWRLGVGTCGSYFARVAWLDEAKNRTYFAKPDGQVYELWFTVCQ